MQALYQLSYSPAVRCVSLRFRAANKKNFSL
ncbi:protein of unknown function [Streptomyces sp. KY75]|nr:protein of unknown function [Streptomyces sp. KY75]CAD5986031.1 protein of unknown function [Streptomyces sp. KY70]